MTYNLTVHVPHSTELRLRDMNGGIRAGQTSGKFDINNVNGPVNMNSVAGTGSVRTVNGEIAGDLHRESESADRLSAQ